MPAPILVDLCQRRIESMQLALESLKPRNGGKTSAADIRDLVQEAIDWPASLRRMWKWTIKRLATFEIENVNEGRQIIKSLFDKVNQLLRSLRDLAAAHADFGRPSEAVESLEAAIGEIERLHSDAFAHWSELTAKSLDMARSQYERGEYTDVEDVLRGLQSKAS